MRRYGDEYLGSDVSRRPWTRAERRVVLRGFLGRLLIAIEPLAVAIFFAILPIGMLLRHQEATLLLTPIFAFASLGFLIYAIALMTPSTRALIETFGPIYTVDGYVRYFSTTTPHLQHYVAVLTSERRKLGEWPLRERPGFTGVREIWPVLVEFSPYGGIHKIDGRPTGVLPAEIAPFGVGVARDDEQKASGFG